ncbi:Uncharacterised protein [Vibrio cholerae]|nr:Uncharacterised protein [Vibrio cholerae]CSB81409.1 Uncharacterised protein [Vibrio cholerae]CSC18987.1 Uncharacterised protein [Vibrio cholerae]CSC61303.1 Uncharacterised protein [Vibrio cholerae]CSC62805.1 Uncharacterised protein [Vibrio cholerae]
MPPVSEAILTAINVSAPMCSGFANKVKVIPTKIVCSSTSATISSNFCQYKCNFGQCWRAMTAASQTTQGMSSINGLDWSGSNTKITPAKSMSLSNQTQT